MTYKHEINQVDEIDEIASNFEFSIDPSSQYEPSGDFYTHNLGGPVPYQACAQQASQTVTTCSCQAISTTIIPFSPCPSGDLQPSNVKAHRPENMNLLRLLDNSLFLVVAPPCYKRYNNLGKLLNVWRFEMLKSVLQDFSSKLVDLQDGVPGNYFQMSRFLQDIIRNFNINANIFVFESQEQTYELRRQNFSEFNFSRNYVLTQLNKVSYIKTLLLPHNWSNFRFRDEIIRKFPVLMGNNEFECLADDIARGCNVVFTADKTGLRVYMSRNFSTPQAQIDGQNLRINLQAVKKKRANSVLFVQFGGTGDVQFSNNQIVMAYLVCERCTQLQCQNCELQQLDIGLCSRLRKLYAFQNQLKRLSLKANRELEVLCVHQNQITELDVSSNSKLTWLGAQCNQIGGLDLRQNDKLQELFLNDNNIASIDVTPCTSLRILNIENNQLTELSIENCARLFFLLAKDNFLYALNASGCKALQEIRISSVCQRFDITISKEENTRIYFEE